MTTKRPVTGSLRSAKPHMQNIPIRTELGRQVREAYEPKLELYENVDYPELELRILAQQKGNKE